LTTMTNIVLSVVALATVSLDPVSSFSFQPAFGSISIRDSFGTQPSTFTALYSTEDSSTSTSSNAEEDEEPRLILDSEVMNQQLNQMKSKYPTAEADYLAAARKRAEQKLESVNHMATDEEWQGLDQEVKKQTGGNIQDGWEASLKEAGDAETSQILISTELEGEEGEDPPEPTLLL